MDDHADSFAHQYGHPGLHARNGHSRGGGSHLARHPHHLAGPRSRSTTSLPVSELDQAAAILAAQGGNGNVHHTLGTGPYGMMPPPPSITIAANGVPHQMVDGPEEEPRSPTSSIASLGSTISSAGIPHHHMPPGAGEHISRSRPPGPRGPGGRSCSPRYYRPPPGSYCPPSRGHPPPRQGPPWAGGQPPGGPPRGPPMFRPPHHVTARSPSPSPPYSPRPGGTVIRRGGPPPPGHHPRFRGGPPRYRGSGPPRHGGPHHYPPGAQSAPHSPVMPQRPFDNNGVKSPPGSTCSEFSAPTTTEVVPGSPIQRHGGVRRPSRLMGMAGGLLAAATGNVNATNNENASHSANNVQHHQQAPSSSTSAPGTGSSHSTGHQDGGDPHAEEDFIQEERDEVPINQSQSSSGYQMKIDSQAKPFSKAKPIGESFCSNHKTFSYCHIVLLCMNGLKTYQ